MQKRNNKINDVGVSPTLMKEQLLKRKCELERTLETISRFKQIQPEGKLRVQNAKGKPQYYRILDSTDTIGKYIRKENQDIAKALAQKSYNQKIEISIIHEINLIEQYLTILDNSSETIYDNLINARKILVSPYLPSDEEYKRIWQAQSYESDPYYPENLVYETKRGEKVRSKSEMLIADTYYDLGIPYRYEAKLDIGGGSYKYPDFTALNVRTREVIYHEHFGLFDDEQYRITNLKKIEQYQKAGIMLGKNLIVTFETEKSPLNIQMIREMLREVME